MEELNQLCRLCASDMKVQESYPITKPEDFKKIDSLLPVKISMLDLLPKLICGDCNTKLKQLSDFQSKCLEAEKNLTEILCTKLKDEQNFLKCISMNVLQDNIIQNSSKSPENFEIANYETVEERMNSEENSIYVQNVLKPLHTKLPDVLPFNTNSVLEVGQQFQGVSGSQICEQLENNMPVENLLIDEAVFSDLHLTYRDVIEAVDSEGNITLQHDETIADLQNNMQIDNSSGFEIQNLENFENSDSLSDPISLDGTNSSLTALSTASLNSLCDISSIMLHYTKAEKDLIFNNSVNATEGNGWFVCPFCSESFPDLVDFSSHFCGHFCDCSTCDLSFTSSEALHIHKKKCRCNQVLQQQAKPQKASLKCIYCDKRYNSKYNLELHIVTHTGDQPFPCKFCNKAFKSPRGLAQHMAHVHAHGDLGYTCDDCGKGFNTKGYLILHRRVHVKVKLRQCQYCDKSFKTKQALVLHENSHKGIKSHLCDICGKRFAQKATWKKHLKIHQGLADEKHECSVCFKTFSRKDSLVVHQRMHTGEKPFHCSFCNKSFNTKGELKVHETNHTGEKKFKCEFCSKSFARNSALLCHRRSHTGERPYRCELCGRTFTQYTPLITHCKKVHNNICETFSCNFCQKPFAKKREFNSHQKACNKLSAKRMDKTYRIERIIDRSTDDEESGYAKSDSESNENENNTNYLRENRKIAKLRIKITSKQ